MPGMLLHIDGSKHQWLNDDRWHDLIVILDDATSEVYYAQLVEEESTRTVMAALRKVIRPPLAVGKKSVSQFPGWMHGYHSRASGGGRVDPIWSARRRPLPDDRGGAARHPIPGGPWKRRATATSQRPKTQGITFPFISFHPSGAL